jgi:hypothetical protein
MSEKLASSRSPFRQLKVGREVLRNANSLERQRAATFEKLFKFSRPEGKEQYLYGRAPIIQPESPSPLAAMLLDGLADETIKLKNATKESPELVDESLQGLAILALTQVEHQRPYGDHTVPGELDGWFIGNMHVTSLTYGSEVAVCYTVAIYGFLC